MYHGRMRGTQRPSIAHAVWLFISIGCSAPDRPDAVPPDARVAGAPAPYDVLITGGRVVDGTGAPWLIADIGIRGDRIAAVGQLAAAEATTRIDARDLVVAPGFVDLLGQSEFNVLVDNRVASKVTQGVTTEITGEGTSIAPVNDRMIKDRSASYQHFGVTPDWHTLDEYFAHLERSKSAINIGTFVGSGGLRDYVMGSDDRPATPAELDQMRMLARQAMEDGALGVSSSLQLQQGLKWAGRVPADLGARGRHRRAARQARGSRRAGAHQEGHGRPERRV